MKFHLIQSIAISIIILFYSNLDPFSYVALPHTHTHPPRGNYTVEYRRTFSLLNLYHARLSFDVHLMN